MPADLYHELLDPAAYPNPSTEVEHLETHISHLYFVGDLVYKVKKRVDFGFLDYTTLAAREHFCTEEVRLNLRLAPDTYLGVVPIRRTPAGDIAVAGADGEVVDYAVQMHRLPAHRMLDHLLDAGDLDNEMIRDLAHRIAAFHAATATGAGVDEFGSLDVVRANCAENFAQTREFATTDGPVSPALHAFLQRRTTAFLAEHEELFSARVSEGRIREGHGDLHAGNICMRDDGIVIYDCIEFTPRFRCGDVAADLAFLLMDLDLRCFRAFAGYLLHSYVERSGDEGLPQLIDFYKGYRAFVRGKVATLKWAALGDEESSAAARTEARTQAMDYFHLAASYELPPALILCCGLPGSGKSYVAAHLARPFEAVITNSDVTRKRLAGIPATQHLDSEIDHGLYSAKQSEQTYAELLRHAEVALTKGRTVIVDAGFRSADQRRPFVELARQSQAPLVVVHVDTPEAVILPRLQARANKTDEISDAGVEVYRAVAQRFEPPSEIASAQRQRYDGIAPIADLTSATIDRLIPSG